MYNNQDILRKHTALTLGRKSINTSFIMFPVRLETRFVDDYPVEDVSEPDLALYAFQALWDYVDALAKPDKDRLLGLARQVMRKVEDLDTVYREDRLRLRTLAERIVDAVKPTGAEKEIWDRILVHVNRLTTMRTVVDSEATDFLNRLEHVNKTIKNLWCKRFYTGKDRRRYVYSFSQTAYVNFARKRLQDCLPVLEMLLPDNPADTIVNKFTLLTDAQVKRFQKATGFFQVTRAQLQSFYGNPSGAGEKDSLSLKQEIIDGFNRDLDAYEMYCIRFLGQGGRSPVKGREKALMDKVRSRVGEHYRYTYFAQKLITWRLRLLTGRRVDHAYESKVIQWRTIASNTVFSFHEEREWLRSVLQRFNAYKESHGQGNRKVSLSRLNRHSKVIRPRKLRLVKKQKCLLVRIYPDEVAVTQMARPLTKDEVNHALDFWIRYTYEFNDERKQKAAWESLCALYTPSRAAFIARNLFRPCEPCIKQMREEGERYKSRRGLTLEQYDAIIRPKMVSKLATTGVDDPGKSLFPVPMSELLPDRFVLQATLDNGKRKEVTIIRYGHLVPHTLQVGMDLNQEAQMSSSDGTSIRFDDNLRWMTDYGEAERMGMAITLPLAAFKWEKMQPSSNQRYRKCTPRSFSFSSIYVMGVKDFSPDYYEDGKACSSLLQELFNAHLYSEEGLDLLKVGTPTNILDDADIPSANSDYDTETSALVNDFYRKSIVPLAKGGRFYDSDSDAGILSSLFGIAEGDQENNPFFNTANWNNLEIAKAKAVNEAFLWELKDEAQPLLRALSNSERLSPYFRHHVLATGVFPSFRVGNQPYGIVPVCDFKDLSYEHDDPLETVLKVLLLLTKHWNEMVDESVLSEENINKRRALSTEESFLKAASCTPVSMSFYERAAVQEKDLLPAQYFRGSKSDVTPISDIYKILSRWIPRGNLSKFIEEYIPRFHEIPIRDTLYTRYSRFFDWGKLQTRIQKGLKRREGMENLDEEELKTLITGSFDLFNYRLDAWLTGLLSLRLSERMEKKCHRVSIGAYGWVFNLKEDAKEPVSNEYIVAPSVNQAITAAVLRSSFNRAANGRSKDYNLSVNLSSSRVRQALRIIQGIRNGLSLGTILGSDLERMLHDDHKKPDGYEMDYFIYFLRKAYPLNRTDTQYAAGDSAKRDASLDVLNGVALLEDLRSVKVDNQQKFQLTELFNWSDDRKHNLWTFLFKIFQKQDQDYIKGLTENFEAKASRLIVLIQRMEDAYDALADVITSESVYKLTEGNRVAVEALMNSMNTGRSFPEPDVVEIPLDSAHIEQRVFAALDPDAEGDSTPADSFFRRVEPSLDQWMGQMLGVEDIRVQLTIDGGTATYPLAKPVSEGGLDITASELVYLSHDWDKFRNFLSLLRWQKAENLHVKRLRAGGILLQEAEMAVDSMREMVAHARPLKQEDLIVSTISPDEALYDSKLLMQRFNNASRRVTAVLLDLKKTADEVEKHFVDNPYLPLTEARLKQVVGHLLKCFRLGLTDALSEIDPETLLVEADFRFEQPVEYNRILGCQQALVNKMRNNAAILEERVDQAKNIVADGKKGDEWETYPEAMKKLFGSYFIQVPRFKLQGNTAIASDQLSRQTPGYFVNAGKSVVEENLVGLSDVRTQVQALHQIRMYGKMNFLDAARDIRPMQLEAEPKDDRNWMGAEAADESSVRDASVYTVLNPSALIVPEKDGLRDVAGLMIDYWVERIPYRNQTAAVAFGYDQPDAEPPQAILLGMSPLQGRHYWSEKKMLRMIRSAMYQVKSRAVEPEHVYAHPWTSGLFPLVSIDPKTEL